MSERDRTTRGATPGERDTDPREQRLRALLVTAHPWVDPPEGLRRRVTERVAQQAARTARPGRWPWMSIRWETAAGAVAAALFLTLTGSVLVRMAHRRSSEQRAPSVALLPSPEGPARTGTASKFLPPLQGGGIGSSISSGQGSMGVSFGQRGGKLASLRPPPPTPPPTSEEGSPRSTALATPLPQNWGRVPTPFGGGLSAPPGWDGGRGWGPASARPIAPPSRGLLSHAPVTDDFAELNDDPAGAGRQWAPKHQDEWDRIEVRVRSGVRVRDDFVQIPFPRVAANSDRAVVAATEAYRREAAIVDDRLAREVTCAFKATALSDLCDRLRADTGIHLAAGNSVADEKVTLFCEKQPLRDVMRQLSRPFGYTWLRSSREADRGAYRYELVQDLKSQLVEEELRNRDRNLALLALEKEIDRYRPYLHLLPDEALARAKTAPPEEKRLLETLSGKGWGVIQMYARLSARDQAALRAGKQVRFATRPGPGDQPLPPAIQRGVLQAFRDWMVVRDGDVYKGAWEPDTPGAVSAATLSVSVTEASVGLRLGQSELGRLGLHGDVYWSIPGNKVGGGGSDEGVAEAMSPAVAKPDNRAANARLAHEPAFRARVTVVPVAHRPSSGIAGDANRRPAGDEPKVTTADVLEALHRATGMPVVADYYTRLYKPETVSASGRPLFEALAELSETMRFRWGRDGGADTPSTRSTGTRSWLQFRSASYYDDRLKEVPNRLLSRWATARQKNGALTLDELCEIAQLSEAQLNAREMGEGARELFGLKEWNLASNTNLRGSLRLLAEFTPAQRQEATTTAGLALTRMSLAQQQRYIALALETSDQPLRSLDELNGATLRVEYTQPGWFQWGDPNHPGRGFYTRWVVPLELTPRGRRVPRPVIRERTREAAWQAVQRVDPQLRQALLQATRRANPRLLDSARVVEEDQIFPSPLDLNIVYIPGATNGRDLHVRCVNANYNPGLE